MKYKHRKIDYSKYSKKSLSKTWEALRTKWFVSIKNTFLKFMSGKSLEKKRFWIIFRLNSGIRNRHNFFVWAIFIFEKLGTDSVNYADSRDIKILIWFPGKSILKFAIIFWKCVGGAQMCGWNILKIAQCVNLITPVIFICKIRGTYLILPKPTQFQPT